MRNNIKNILIIFPVIFLLCVSFIGTTVKAEDNLYNTDSTTATSNQNEKSNNAATTNDNSTDTDESKINTSSSKTDSKNDNTVNDQASQAGKNDETTATEVILGWKNIEGKLYYFTKDGMLKKTGWLKEKSKDSNSNSDREYYLDEDYAATIGWKKIKGLWYYFDESGIKQTGWKLINYNWYHLDEDGIMNTGWIKIDNNKYYLNDEGIMTVGKKYIKDNWYFFGDSGILQTGFYLYKGKSYYSNSNGVMVSNQWIKTKKDNKYYVKADSSIATGYAIIDNQMEEFNSNGRYLGSAQMEAHLFIKQLNVGDADCAFIKLPSGETVLIDTGDKSTSEKVIKFLNEQNLKLDGNKRVIDYIIITHAHSDHIGGLASILEKFKVEKVYMPDIAKMEDWYSNVKVTTESSASVDMMKVDYDIYEDAVKAMEKNNIEFTNTKRGDFLDKNKILEFVQSDKNFGPIGSEKITEYYWGINENSAVAYLNYGDLQALFTGDMEWNSEKDFWVNDLLSGRNVDVLKVPHHGHDTSSTVGFITYLKPTIGIISRGKKNVEKNTAYNNLISNKVSLYETSEKDGVSIYATEENWTLEN